MPRPWSADRVVTRELACALIAKQFPQLGDVQADMLGVGWDNTAYRVNGDWVFRFPRRMLGVSCLEAELRVVPRIAGLMTLEVSEPLLVGRPSEEFDWPFAGYRFIEGRTACDAALGQQERTDLAAPVAHFLAELHAIGPEQGSGLGAGGDTIGRLDGGRLVRSSRENLSRAAQLGLAVDTPRLTAIAEAWSQTSAGSDSDPPCALVHGDFYSRHLLLDDGGRPRGVIDWGDIHLGNPAVDLAIAHGFFPPGAQAAFRAAYGEIDERTWELARLRAIFHASAVVLYAHDVGDAPLLAEGLVCLGHLAAG